MIGWYVHHHGSGHLHRLLAVREHLGEVTGIGSGPHPDGFPWLELPMDSGNYSQDPTAGGTLHWAPVGHAGLRRRMARLANWIDTARPSVRVVDVSVEVALLSRLVGVPTVLIAQRGVRCDRAHRVAYDQAAAVAAPWSKHTHLLGEGPPDERLHFVGAISRFDHHAFEAAPARDDVLVLVGAGGSRIRSEEIQSAAAATSHRHWHVVGVPHTAGPNITCYGPGVDVGRLLNECSVVVGSAGGHVVAEVAAARRPLVCLPQPRPFDEQRRQADALRRLGTALVRQSWPRAGDWPGTLSAAEAIDVSRWGQLHDGHGGARLGALIGQVAS